MNTQTQSPEEIRNAGLAALERELGVVGNVRWSTARIGEEKKELEKSGFCGNHTIPTSAIAA